MVTTSIRKWGNSQGLYIPKDMLRQIGVMVNDQVTMSLENGAILIRPGSANNKREAAFASMQEIRKNALDARTSAGAAAVRDYRKEYEDYLDERYKD